MKAKWTQQITRIGPRLQVGLSVASVLFTEDTLQRRLLLVLMILVVVGVLGFRVPSTSLKNAGKLQRQRFTPRKKIDATSERAAVRALSCMAYASPALSPSLPMPPDDDNADVGLTYTEGMHDQQIAQVLLTHDAGGDCKYLGVPHHTDRTLPEPKAGHVYLQTCSQWDGKRFRSEQKRPRIPDGMRCVPLLLTWQPPRWPAHDSHNSTATSAFLCATVGTSGTVRVR